jgi:transcription termination factor Rho
MELHLDRRLADQRVWPAIDIPRSGTRREELLLREEELRCTSLLRKVLSDRRPAEALQHLTNRLKRSASNAAFLTSLAG